MSYDNNKSQHKKLAVIRMVKVGSDSFLGVDINLGQEYQADSNKEPLIQVRKQQDRVDQEETAITDQVEPADDCPQVHTDIARLEN